MSNATSKKEEKPKIELSEHGEKQRRKRHIQSIICTVICIIAVLIVLGLFSDGFATGLKNIVVAIFTMSAKLLGVIAVVGIVGGFLVWIIFFS